MLVEPELLMVTSKLDGFVGVGDGVEVGVGVGVRFAIGADVEFVFLTTGV